MHYKTLVTGLALLPALAYAEQTPMVITITGYGIPTTQALVPVQVFDRQQILTNNGGDLSNLLSTANGLELAGNGGPGQTTSLFFRGTNSNQNLVMVDGVPINTATTGAASIGTMDTQLLQRIEVVSGPQSTLWGSGAIGGVVNIDTLPAYASGTHSFADFGHGSHNSTRASVGVNHAGTQGRFSVGIARYTTDGIPPVRGSTVSGAYDNTSVNLAAAHKFGAFEVQALHWQTQGTSHYASFTFPPPSYSLVLAPVSQDFLTSVSSLKLTGQLRHNITSELQLSLARDHIDQNNSADYAHTDRTTLTWRNTAVLTPNDRLSFGVEANWERAAILSFGNHYAGTTPYQAVYAQWNAHRGKHHWLTGARLFHHGAAGTHATWNIGYGYDLSNSTRLKANLSTGYRYPTAVERYVFSPNPNLRPEQSRALELGISQQIDSAQKISLSLFRTDIDDLIVSTGSFPNSRNVNINKARITGAELRYQFDRGPWSLHASAIAQNPRNLSDNKQLLRRARFSTKAGLDYQASHWSGGAQLIYNGQRPDVQGLPPYGPTTDGAYALVNLHASYKLSPSFSLFGSIDNLFDRQYEQVADYNTLGRTLFVGIRYRTP